MGEIDTKPIESVKAQLSMFGQKTDRRKFRSTGNGEAEDKKLDFVLKDLASYKVQLEIKESANKQALLKLDFCHKTIEELSAQLKKSEADTDKCMKEFAEARNHIDALEFENKEISARLMESEKAQERLMSSVNDLNATQELLKEELTAAEELKQSALDQVELMETAIDMEKQKSGELLRHASELNEAIQLSKLAATEIEKEKAGILLEKDEEMHLSVSKAMQAYELLEEIRRQVDVAKGLENQLLYNSVLFDSLQSEHEHVKESYIGAINDLNRLKLEMECMEKGSSEHAIYIESMEAELKQSQEELLNAREEIDSLKNQIEDVTTEMQKARVNIAELREKENEGQIEIALLKSEIHKEKAKVAAAEAAEARGKSSKLGLYLAVQQLAVEAEKAKEETQRLKQKAQQAENVVDIKNPIGELDTLMAEEPVDKPDSFGFCSGIFISSEEYESLVQKAAKADTVLELQPQECSHESVNSNELENLKKELESKYAEIRDLRSVADEAIRRANMAENAKVAIEGQLRKWREQKQKQREAQREALAVIHREPTLREINPPIPDKSSAYVPLGKVLNMKF